MWFWILVLPGLACAYFLFLRPVLAALPALKKFYSEADGFWAKVSALAWHDLTIAWGYLLAAVSFGLSYIEPIGAMLGDPDIKTQITSTLQADPQALAYFAMFVSAVTIAAKLHQMTKSP